MSRSKTKGMENTKGIMMAKQYTLEDFIEIIGMLRSEGGCPWDKEQTHESLKPCMMEEAAELVAAIRIYDKTGNAENMREELGDILLQVVMHSQIAKEEGIFTFEEVVQEISEKMIRRHPHVFGDVRVDSSADVLINWDEIKKKEKEGKTWIESPLQEIPLELPALTRAVKIIKKVDKLYEPQKEYQQVLDDLSENIINLKKLNPKTQKKQIEEAVGELLFNVSHISHVEKISQEQILMDKIEEFVEKYEPIREKRQKEE